MAKIQIKSENLTLFGEIFSIMEQFDMCTRKKDVERLSCGFEFFEISYLHLPCYCY